MKKTFLFSGVVLVIILFICSIMIKWQPNYSMISPTSQKLFGQHCQKRNE